jgi:hypothetical protein
VRVALVVLGLGVAACGSGKGNSSASTTTTTVSGVPSERRIAQPIHKVKVVDDSHLFVTFNRPSCQASAGHTAKFGSDAVTVTMYTTLGDPGCAGGVGEGSDTVVLDHPLAGRKIADGACAAGQPYADSTDCQNGFATE